MANSFVYNLALQGFLEGSFDMASATIKLALVTSSYVPNQSTDQFLSIATANIVARSATLTSPTTADGIFGAANTVFSTVSGAACNAMVLYIDAGADSVCPVIAYLYSDYYSGLPITPNGGNIDVSFSPTGNLIFSL
jgi:hypothetical protein